VGVGPVGRLFARVRNSKTRSAEARLDCRRFIWPAICMIGIVNWREYWMKAVTAPRVSRPDATR